MMRGENAAIVFGFFGSDVGDEDAIGSGGGSRSREFFQAHLEDWIVVAEEDDGDFGGGGIRFANFAN